MPLVRLLAANLSFVLVGYYTATMLTAWYVGGLDRIVWALVIKPVLGIAPFLFLGIAAGWLTARRR